MAQAIRAITTRAPGNQPAINDNNPSPKGNPWHPVIKGMTAVCPQAGIAAWMGYRSGMTVEEFCEIVIDRCGGRG